MARLAPCFAKSRGKPHVGYGGDILVGGSGKDTFQFARGIERSRDFDLKLDVIDVAGGDSAVFHNFSET